MSMMSAIRLATRGANKPRLEDTKPEAEDEEDETSAETGQEEPEAEDGDEEPADEDEEDEAEAEEEEEKKPDASAAAKHYARGWKAQKKRMSAILGSAAAEANPALAAHLAFATDDSAAKALAALKAAGPAAAANSLSSRMNARQPSQLGRGGDANPRAKDAGAAWDGALAKAGVAKKGK
jgi:cobalamin biosynthesis protein CobT